MLLLLKSEVRVAPHVRDGHAVRAYIRRVAKFAAAKHRGQFRKDGKTPYISHPVTVANILVREGKVADPEVIAAALLHDTIKDTGTTRDELEREFGPRVAAMVAELTNDPGLHGAESKAAQLKKKFGPDAAAVKIADKTANLRDILARPPATWSASRKRAYFDHAAALVSRIGSMHPVLADVFKRTHERVSEIR